MKKVHVKTWGCQMNVYDSERMVDLLAPHGWQPTERAEEADLIILNTCHIREKASEKLYSELGRLKPAKERGAMIAVAGCVAQAEGAEIIARAPMVDLVFGPQTYHTLPDMLAQARRRALVNTDFPPEPKFDHLPHALAAPGPAAFLAIQEGCDKFCSFCVVPYTRGAEYSRPAAAILAEARRLVAGGAVELTLLGQNVNAWHGEGEGGGAWSLGRLLFALAEIPRLARLRYTTSHPRDMHDELVRAHAEIPQLMPFLPLPVQSGSDRILKAMNRKHGAAEYLAVIARLRAARADMAFSSDFIVGFPGETDADFAATLDLVRAVGFASAYSFKYSPRPGTPAAEQEAQVPEGVKDERLRALQQVLDAQSLAFNAGFVGRRVTVLFDRPGKRPGQLIGRTPHNQSLFAAAPPRLMGQMAEVEVVAAHGHSLEGRVALVEAA